MDKDQRLICVDRAHPTDARFKIHPLSDDRDIGMSTALNYQVLIIHGFWRCEIIKIWTPFNGLQVFAQKHRRVEVAAAVGVVKGLTGGITMYSFAVAVMELNQ